MTRRILALALVAGLGGCGGKDGPEPVRFDAPWEDVKASKQKIDGAFHAELGADYPGGGWFKAPDHAGDDAARARIVQVPGATWPVVHIEVLGWTEAGWNTLTFDVGQPRWAAGDVPVDGDAAIGRLTAADGTVRYLVDGSLHVTDPGLDDGQVVAGWFSDVVLSEVAR